MTKKPLIPVGVRKDDKGDITHIKFRGNASVTPLPAAVNMAKRGEIAHHHVVEGKTKEFLRSNPDKTQRNNLDDLPEV